MQNQSNSKDSNDELTAWLRLVNAPKLGPKTLLQLIEHYGTAKAIVENAHAILSHGQIKQASFDAISQPDEQVIEDSLIWLNSRENHFILYWGHPQYPEALARIPDPPVLTYCIGRLELLGTPALGIVGSRNPSQIGYENATEFARSMAQSGITIISGMASGIDGAAHKGALSVGGDTIAVIGTGPDRVYPASHRELAHDIAEHGLILSEFSPGTPARSFNFPKRNRIITALSLGTLVVEAALKSGSLISARLAMEQGKEVFAIPGSIHNPLARGCHQLIKQGAKLVESAKDIIEEIAPALSEFLPALEKEPIDHQLEGDEAAIFDAVDQSPTTVDQIIARTKLSLQQVTSAIMALELQGLVMPVAGGYQRH